MGTELENLKAENDSLKKSNEYIKKNNTELENKLKETQAENGSLAEAQQGFKAKIKELTEQPPKVTSGHVAGSIKYKRQNRVKK